MSVAVAQLPQAFQALPMQTPSHPDLLEALLTSCQKPAMTTPLPGFGRDLIPYFSPETAEPAPKARSKSRSGSASPPHGYSKASAAAAAMVAAAKKPSKGAGSKPASAKMTVAQAEKKRAIQLAALMSSWAGPGFCVAPRPDKLPVPSAALLD